MKANGKNERVKREYFIYLREARRYSSDSIDVVAKALDRFEVYVGHRDFATFRTEQAVGFKAHLAEQNSSRGRQMLSLSTRRQTLAALREFFIWLAGRPGFKSRVQYSDAEYFNLSLKDEAAARTHANSEGPSMIQVRHVINTMPTQTDIERRNRALVAFLILTGVRDDAAASLRLKHMDLLRDEVFQDPREVRTKKSKTMRTWFFPVGDDIRAIVADFVEFLRVERRWGPDDPLFPATRIVRGVSGAFEADGLDRSGWKDASRIRAIVRDAFERAGLPYFNPHSFRKTLARLGLEVTRGDHEAMKAWSQNLGHESMLTTLTSYGTIPAERQREILLQLNTRSDSSSIEDDPEVRALLLQVARKIGSHS